MENKINLVELLKDCPKGMELDCAIYENVELDYIEQDPKSVYPIHCLIKINGGYNPLVLTYSGCNDRHPYAKCVIFPKGKNTWEGFHIPFKDGDIISDGNFDAICIFKGEGSIKGTVDFYCGISGTDELFIKDVKNQDEHFGEIDGYNFATEEEKEKLFKVIKDNGYRWDAETKTLEQWIEPKFKVGDCIIHKKYKTEYTIRKINKGSYTLEEFENGYTTLDFDRQKEWELVPNKFDINALIPFESKVLVRDSEAEKWRPAIWGYYDSDSTYNYPYEVVGGHSFSMCIPYEGNEYLRGKTDDCNDFYKTWE